MNRNKILKELLDEINERFTQEKTDETSVAFSFKWQGYTIDFYATCEDIEIVIDNPKHRFRFYENVCDWLESHVTGWYDIPYEVISEYDLNGFRDETDYLFYKYG